MVFQRTIDDSPAPTVTRVHSPDPMFRLVRSGAFPSFSPDGRHIVYSNSGRRIAGMGSAPSTETPASTLFVANVDGSDVRVLFSDPEQSALGAAWSPRGDRIAFGTGVSQPRPTRFGPAQVDVIAPDGTGVRRVTPDDGGNYMFPSWSPDGQRLVLRAARPASKGLFLVGVDSGAMSTLTPDLGTDNLPAWSPTSDLIAFTSRRDGDWEIYTIKVDGSGLTRLTRSPGNDAHVAWSPDGRWLAFSSARGGFKDEMARAASGGQGATDIFVMRSDGTGVRRLTDDAAEEGTVAFAWK
jgi:Tol biopolymer transport system component